MAAASHQLSPSDLASLFSARVTETSLSRAAQKFSPVLYPFPDIVQDWSEAVTGLEFTLTHLFASVEGTTAYIDGNATLEGKRRFEPM